MRARHIAAVVAAGLLALTAWQPASLAASDLPRIDGGRVQVIDGDTLYPALEITDLKGQRSTGVITMRATIHNQKRELVLDGWHKYLVKKRG